jgi:hypothetical protein
MEIGVDAKGEAENRTIKIRTIGNLLEYGTDEKILTLQASAGTEDGARSFVHLIEVCGANGATEFSKCNTFNLADALACDIELLSNLLQRLLLAALKGKPPADDLRLFVGKNKKEGAKKLLKIDAESSTGLGRCCSGRICHKRSWEKNNPRFTKYLTEAKDQIQIWLDATYHL